MNNQGLTIKADITGGMHENRKHDSAHKHVTGTADYIDDMPEPEGTLHGALGMTDRANAKIVSMDLSEVEKAPGVVLVMTAKDMPGSNDISPSNRHDEPVLADNAVQFHGQPAFAVIAKTRDQARKAARLAKITYADLPHITDVAEAQKSGGELVTPGMVLSRGDAKAGLARSKNRIKAQMRIGGQEHFYLESHIALAIPGEDEDVTVWASTQHPSEVQHMVAHVLGIQSHAVTVNVRRMGGGFGGKETQGNQFAALAAVAAKKLNKAVKFRPDRDEDMSVTGKRHDFLVDYELGFDDDGLIEAVEANFAARCGFSSDLSGPVTDRALFHADSSYYYPNVHLTSQPLKTNTVSNTAYRGFGGPQGMVGGERFIEEIAYALGKDPLEIRKRNFYGLPGSDRVVTPYHQTVEDNIIHQVVDELETSSNYQARRKAILEFNASSRVLKKALRSRLSNSAFPSP